MVKLSRVRVLLVVAGALIPAAAFAHRRATKAERNAVLTAVVRQGQLSKDLASNPWFVALWCSAPTREGTRTDSDADLAVIVERDGFRSGVRRAPGLGYFAILRDQSGRAWQDRLTGPRWSMTSPRGAHYIAATGRPPPPRAPASLAGCDGRARSVVWR